MRRSERFAACVLVAAVLGVARLRAAAPLDTKAFVAAIKTLTRTNVTVALEDHALMCESLSSNSSGALGK